MNRLAIVLPLAVEWVLVTTSFAPAMKGRFSRAPRIGIAIWFALFLSSFLAVITAFVVAIILSIHWRETMPVRDLPVGVQFVVAVWPWVLLALGGATLGLTATRVEPWLEGRKSAPGLSTLAVTDKSEFHGVLVETVSLPVAFAFSTNKPVHRIVLTDRVSSELSSTEFNAVLWHEWAHITQRHNEVKSLVRLIARLTSFIRASRLMTSEVDRLCELAADQVSIGKLGNQSISAARAKLNQQLGSLN